METKTQRIQKAKNGNQWNSRKRRREIELFAIKTNWTNNHKTKWYYTTWQC